MKGEVGGVMGVVISRPGRYGAVWALGRSLTFIFTQGANWCPLCEQSHAGSSGNGAVQGTW